MEIYNEKLRDLFDCDLQKSNNSINSIGTGSMYSQVATKQLKIREHPTKGIYVQNLNQFNVTDLKNTMKYLCKGNQSRLDIDLEFE